jgi:hypothetical protein
MYHESEMPMLDLPEYFFIDVQVAECSYPTSAKHSGPLDLVILYQGLVEPQSHVNTHEDR